MGGPEPEAERRVVEAPEDMADSDTDRSRRRKIRRAPDAAGWRPPYVWSQVLIFSECDFRTRRTSRSA